MNKIIFQFIIMSTFFLFLPSFVFAASCTTTTANHFFNVSHEYYDFTAPGDAACATYGAGLVAGNQVIISGSLLNDGTYTLANPPYAGGSFEFTTGFISETTSYAVTLTDVGGGGGGGAYNPLVAATSTPSQAQQNLFNGFVVFFISMLFPIWFFKRR